MLVSRGLKKKKKQKRGQEENKKGNKGESIMKITKHLHVGGIKNII
jgi:hypothetical protein